MPKQTRYAIKQLLTSAQNELDKAEMKIVVLGSQFHDDHPDHYKILCGLSNAISMIKGQVKTFSDNI